MLGRQTTVPNACCGCIKRGKLKDSTQSATNCVSIPGCISLPEFYQSETSTKQCSNRCKHTKTLHIMQATLGNSELMIRVLLHRFLRVPVRKIPTDSMTIHRMLPFALISFHAVD